MFDAVASFVLHTSRGSSFLGQGRDNLFLRILEDFDDSVAGYGSIGSNTAVESMVPQRKSYMVMRKSKAKDNQIRRRAVETEPSLSTFTKSPMEQRGPWSDKQTFVATFEPIQSSGGGRGRSRKRSNLYSSLSFYHDKFLNLLTLEYKSEEDEVVNRIKASVGDPLSLERAGHALYDMYPTRRGNLFADQVYRLVKASDATTRFPVKEAEISTNSTMIRSTFNLPPSHKFAINDVILVTRQPNGSGDIFDPSSLPISETAQKMEARVLGVGPTYIDILVRAGDFEQAFGQPAPNDISGNGDRRLRVRADRFFSPIPYQRMAEALATVAQVPTSSAAAATNKVGATKLAFKPTGSDELIRELVIATHAFGDPESSFYQDTTICNLVELENRISKPPMASSTRLADEVVKHIQSNPLIFRPLNAPQIVAVQAALTRRCTLIQGPPGTGKTTVAAAIGFGFVHQCKSLSVHTKVLACAFSNVGSDNLAEALIRIGLKVVRIGKPCAVSQSLWNNTVDAAIHRDPGVQKALEKAAEATTALTTYQRSKVLSETDDRLVALKQMATLAVKASIQSCDLAATKAFREADVIVSTLTGAADPRLMAACGLGQDCKKDGEMNSGSSTVRRSVAPDGLSPLSLPFVIVDEACQSVEPATLIPLISSNRCRALVLLGDPCQLPPTVQHQESKDSPLSISLMERLAGILPTPNVRSISDKTVYDTSFLGAGAIKQARSIIRGRDPGGAQKISYRQQFAGSFMLSVQYRMHPSIAAFPSSIFYDGLLSTPKHLAKIHPTPVVLRTLFPGDCNGDASVRLVHLGGRNNERRWNGRNGENLPGEEDSTSYANDMEANYVVELLHQIRMENEAGIESVAVISPYNGQVQLIQSLLSNDGDFTTQSNGTTIEVKSVDSFQGRERDIVLFSAVRSNHEGRIGFLRDWRRLNVALTRAKKGLVVIGDFDTLAQFDKNWAALRYWATSAKCVFDPLSPRQQ